MTRLNFCMKAFALFVLWATATLTLPAQTFKTLHNFDNTDAALPWATLVQGNDGNFYGTTQNGGSTACTLGCGTVFRITPNGKLTTFNFDGTNGSQPYAGLVQAANGVFYGVTTSGGVNDLGTVFKFTPNGGLTTLYSFTANTGYGPIGGLVLASDGNFYGTSSSGGPPTGQCKPSGCGTIFKISPKGKYSTIHNFNGIPDGGSPLATMTQAPNGKFYGTASNLGNAGSYGTVFTMTPKGKFTVVHQFNNTDLVLFLLRRPDPGCRWELLRSNGSRGRLRLWRFRYRLQNDAKRQSDDVAQLRTNRRRQPDFTPGSGH